VHILKGCLSDVPPGGKTNGNEHLNKHLNESLSTSKTGVSLAYAITFKLFAHLPSMKEETADYFTSCNLAKLTNDSVQ